MSIKQAIEAHEVVDQVCDAMIQAWTLGQYYRGYSDANPHGAKAEEAHTKFVALLDNARAALAALRSMPQGEPVATIRYARGTPGKENDMPKVVSCNWLPDGVYSVYATPHTEAVRMSEAENWRRIYPLLKAAHETSKATLAEMAERLDKQGIRSIPITEKHAESINASNALTAEFEAIEQATAARLGVKMGDV